MRQYNMQNLIQFNDMSPERHKEISSKGGIASGEARRRKRAMRERLENAMIKHAAMEGFIDDVMEFNSWKRQQAKARAKGERTKDDTKD